MITNWHLKIGNETSDKVKHWRREKKKYYFPILLLSYNPFGPTGIEEIALLALAMGFHHYLIEKSNQGF